MVFESLDHISLGSPENVSP